VGAAANVFSDPTLPFATPERAAVKDLIEWQLEVEGKQASLEDVYGAFQEGGATLIDARSSYAFSRGHIPGALSLPVSQYRASAESVLAGVPKDAPIITYCSGGSCQTSIQLANRLAEDGYTEVRAFYGGWGAWMGAGYQVREGASP